VYITISLENYNIVVEGKYYFVMEVKSYLMVKKDYFVVIVSRNQHPALVDDDVVLDSI
jgi:hypothetical protein